MSKKPRKAPHDCCLNCALLVQPSGGSKDVVPYISLTHTERKALRDGLAPDVQDYYVCAHGVWAPQPGTKPPDKKVCDLFKRRGERCFFYTYDANMLVKGAMELEKREADRREAHRDRRLTRWVLYIALAALILGIVQAYVQQTSPPAVIEWQVPSPDNITTPPE